MGSLSVARILLYAASLFFLSFLMSGNANALPQLFFQRFYPAQKVMLLSISLFLATIAATSGVLASRPNRLGRPMLLAVLTVTAFGALGLFAVTAPYLYIGLTAAVQFGDNFLINSLDHAAVARAGESQRRLVDVAGNAARLLGMLAAPAFFTASYDRPDLMRSVVSFLAALAIIGACSVFPGRSRSEGARVADVTEGRPPDSADKLLFAFAVCVYASLYLFGANIIYLLRDLLQIPGAELRGGLTIVTAFSAALGVNGLLGVFRRKHAGLRVVFLVAAPVLLIVFSAVLAAGLRCGFVTFVTCAGILGSGYGAFLLEIREYASRGAGEGRRSALLTWFNNLGNVSSMVAFSLMATLAATRGPHDVYFWTLCLIAGLSALGLVLLVRAVNQRQAQVASLESEFRVSRA